MWDYLSAVEVPYLDKGDYSLTILIPKAHWLIEQGVPTCLSMDYMMEFIPRDAKQTEEDEFVANPSSGPVTIIMTFPPGHKNLKLGEELKVSVHFDRRLDLRDAAGNMPEVAHLCQLQNMADKKKMLTPTRYFYDKSQAQLSWDFASHG